MEEIISKIEVCFKTERMRRLGEGSILFRDVQKINSVRLLKKDMNTLERTMSLKRPN